MWRRAPDVDLALKLWQGQAARRNCQIALGSGAVTLRVDMLTHSAISKLYLAYVGFAGGIEIAFSPDVVISGKPTDANSNIGNKLPP